MNNGTLRFPILKELPKEIDIPDDKSVTNESLVALLIGTVFRDGDGVRMTVGREAKAVFFCS